jgi:MFS family permease
MLALPLRNRNLGLFTIGSAISLIGMWMQRIGIGWLTWQLTESGFWLGVVAFADFFPVILIGPFAGAIADRLNLLKLMQVTQSVFLVQVIILWLLTLTGLIDIWGLVALSALAGITVSLNQPVRLSFTPTLVSAGELSTAVALHAVVFNSARFIGPLLAGVVIATWDVAAAFGLNALSYVIFLITLACLRWTPPGRPAGPRASFTADFQAGIAYTARHPAIAPLLFLLVAIGLGTRPIEELLPGLADAVFKAGATGLSYMAAAFAAGAIVGSLWFGHRGRGRNLVSVVLVGTALGGTAVILAVATTVFPLALAAMVFLGGGTATAGIALQTLVQLTCDRPILGRVMGIYALIFRGSPAIGALIAGGLSTQFGLRWPIVLGGLVVLIVTFIIYRRRATIQAALLPAATPALAADGDPKA